MEIKGTQFGVRLEYPTKKASSVFVQLLGEDDEYWFDIGNGLSSYWLTDLIDVLKLAREQAKIMMEEESEKEYPE